MVEKLLGKNALRFDFYPKELQLRLQLVLIGAFWYFALFPGRLGFDYSEAIRMMRRGQSTDWWTAEFWWYLKITTFNGRFIYISSLISLIILGMTVYFFVKSLPISDQVKSRTLLIYFCSPLFGAFALNISHDVFQAAGIILFVGIKTRHRREITNKHKLLLEVSASLLVLTTAIGPLLIATYILVSLFERNYKQSVLIILVSLIFANLANFSVTQVPRLGFALVFLGDVKCIVQHPDVKLDEKDWITLEKISTKEIWLAKKPCSFVDRQIEDFSAESIQNTSFSFSLAKLYFKLASEYPAILLVAHFERASQALPPPFFRGPANQIDLNPDVPLGVKTNTALQDGTELLHPSVDEPSVDVNLNFLIPLEALAQTSILVVNQASWFWGWGGLWLWPILYFGLVIQKIRNVRDWFKMYMPIITLHAFLVTILSAPQGRYVMSTITIGFILLIAVIARALMGNSIEMEKEN
jgi:hypothetical protein